MGRRAVSQHFAAGDLVDFTASVLHRWGMPHPQAAEVADLMVEADLRGVDSHGISMLPQYERLVAEGRLDLAARPTVTTTGGGAAVVDAVNGLGHLAMAMAVSTAADMAARQGVAAVGVRRSHHFSAAGVFATLASARGMVALVCSTTRTRAVVPTRASTALLGTNPLALAAPGGDPDAPFLLDMSTSTVAVNKVKVYDQAGEQLPEGWVVDHDGLPVTDPATAHRQVRSQAGGGLNPLGGPEATAGYKGYGLAVAVQLLAGALTGSTFAPLRQATQVHDDIGHFCLVVDPAAFGDAAGFRASVDEIARTLRTLPATDPAEPVLVPGDPEWRAKRRRTAEGVPLFPVLVDLLTAVGERAGAPFPAHRARPVSPRPPGDPAW